LDLRNRGDHLVAEGYIRDLTVDSSNADEAHVRPQAEARQQFLPRRETKAGADLRYEAAGRSVVGVALVVEVNLNARARAKSLKVGEVGEAGILFQVGNTADDRVGKRLRQVLDVHVGLNQRIIRVDGSANTER